MLRWYAEVFESSLILLDDSVCLGCMPVSLWLEYVVVRLSTCYGLSVILFWLLVAQFFPFVS